MATEAEILESLKLDNLDITTEDLDMEMHLENLDLATEGLDVERSHAKAIAEQLAQAEQGCVKDYMMEGTSVASLHTQIFECDGILQKMQGMLSCFQSELGDISSEIKHLQDKSMSMSVQLQNRQQTSERLASFIDMALVPPDLVAQLCEHEIDHEYLPLLAKLGAKLQFVQNPETTQARAREDILPTLLKVRAKVVSRLRYFFLTRLHAFKKLHSNLQYKQDSLLKFRPAFQFLLQHAPDIAHEARHALSMGTDCVQIRRSYVEVLGKRFHLRFKGYWNDLLKLLQPFAVGKEDLLGVEVFALGARADILAADLRREPPPIIPVAQREGRTFSFEEIFRHTHRLLADTAKAEWAFISEFFDTKENAEHGKMMFSHVFAKTLSIFLEHLEDFLFSCFDCVGVLIMLRIVAQLNSDLQKERTHVLGAFFDRENLLLWPRFKMVVDAHISSLAKVKPASVRRTGSMPHWITLRFAHLHAAISFLNQGYSDQILVKVLETLSDCGQKLFMVMSAQISVPKQKSIFLINNYGLFLRVQRNGGVEVERFEALLSAQVALFVEEELSEKFGQLVAFVKQTELSLANRQDGQSAVDVKKMEQIVGHFARFWRDGIERVHDSVSKNFTDIGPATTVEGGRSAGKEILKQVLVQLVLYYQRFQDLIKKSFTSMPPFVKDLVPIPTIMYEIKKYGTRAQ